MKQFVSKLEQTNIQQVEQFLEHLWLVKGLRDNPLAAYKNALSQFILFLNIEKETVLDCSEPSMGSVIANRIAKGFSHR